MAPTTKKPVAQANAAKKAALKGSNAVKSRVVRHEATFRRPKTLRLHRAPKYLRKSVSTDAALDVFRILKAPIASESAMKIIDSTNTIVYRCDQKANKHHIAAAFKTRFGVSPAKINTLHSVKGYKKAFITLPASVTASDVAAKIGFM